MHSIADLIRSSFQYIFAALKLSGSISIKVSWQEADGAYVIDGIAVKTDKAPKGLFSDEMLTAFSDTLQRYEESIAAIKDTRAHEQIIAALEALMDEAGLSLQLSKERIKNFIDTIHTANAMNLNKDKATLDISTFADSRGAAKNLAVSDFVMDYAGVTVGGKKSEILIIIPGVEKKDEAPVPRGYSGDFMKYMFSNQMSKQMAEIVMNQSIGERMQKHLFYPPPAGPVVPDDGNAKSRLAALVQELQNRSQAKMNDPLDNFPECDVFTGSPALGRYLNGKIEVNLYRFTTPLFSEEDVLSTLYHEYWHSYSERTQKYPFRKTPDGLPFVIEDARLFPPDSVVIAMHNAKGTADFQKLSEKKKNEIRFSCATKITYRPSALCEEEIFCYEKQIEGHSKGLYNVKTDVLADYKESLEFYKKRLPEMRAYEQQNNLNSSGYEK